VSGTVRYLSLEWIDQLTRVVAGSAPTVQAAAGREIGLTQVVSDGPEGDVTYHIQVDGDGVRFGAGAAEPEHVRMEQSWDTAVAVATGRLNAQEAFVNGHIRLYGDQCRLLDAQPLFGALDAAFTAVRQRTEYV
jgi:SCP-2 sterol transfer family